MRYYAPIEVMARDDGIQEGIQESILDLLQFRFGDVALSVAQRVQGIKDASVLRSLRRQAQAAASADGFQRYLQGV